MPTRFVLARGTALLTALAAFSLAGCSNNNPPDNNTVVTTPPPAAPAATTTTTTPGATATTTTAGTTTNPATKVNVNAGPGASTGTDTTTAEAVNKAIVTNKQMTGSRIEAVVTSGVCTLTGITQNASQKGIAEQTARRVAGVTEVKNKIEIRPTGGAGATASKPAAPKTKVIVINRTVPAPPAPPQPPASPNPPAKAASSQTNKSSMKSGGAGASDSTGTNKGTDNGSDTTSSSSTDTTTTTTTTGGGQ